MVSTLLAEESYLQAMTSEERVLLFGLTHLADEVRAFQKLYLWSVQGRHNSVPESEGELFMSLLLVRSLAGKMFEGYHKIFVKCFFDTPLQAKYRKLINTEGKRALTAMQRYFEKSDNLAGIIRNQFAFHYSPKKYERMLPKLKEDLKLYIQNNGSANNLYYFAELLVTVALLREIPVRGNKAALRRLNTDMEKITRQFVVACDALISSLIGAYTPKIWKANATPITIANLKPFEEIELPWFSETLNPGIKAA